MEISSKEELFALLEGLQKTVSEQASEIEALKAGNGAGGNDDLGDDNIADDLDKDKDGVVEPEEADEIAQLLEL